MGLLTYKYRIYPNRAQEAALNEMLSDFCWVYNAALEQRITAWGMKRRTLRYMDQAREIKAIRTEFPELQRWSFSALQSVLRRLDHAYQRFRAGGTRLPRYKSASRYRSAGFPFGDGLYIAKGTNKVRVKGISGDIRVKWHRALPAKPCFALVSHQHGRWYLCLSVEVNPSARQSEAAVGVDFGLTNLVALSDGTKVPRPRWTTQMARAMRRKQRAVARTQMGSQARARRTVAVRKLHAKIVAKRTDYCHKLARTLVRDFGRIALEDLNAARLGKGMHSKHVYDAAWGQLAEFIRYKAENAGGEVILVSAHGTSTICPRCERKASKALENRVHECSCGCVMDRDVAAAHVIYHRAFGIWPGAGLGPLSAPDGVKLGPETITCGSSLRPLSG